MKTVTNLEQHFNSEENGEGVIDVAKDDVTETGAVNRILSS